MRYITYVAALTHARAFGLFVCLANCLGISAESFATIEVPGAFETLIFDLNARGNVTGFYRDMNGTGGLSTGAGVGLATFRVKAADTSAYAINDLNEVAGFSTSGNFVRHPSGRLTFIATPDVPLKMNNRGDIIGTFSDGGRTISFFRSRSGQISAIDVDPAMSTAMVDITDLGVMVGFVYGFGSNNTYLSDCVVCRSPADCERIQAPSATQTVCVGVNLTEYVAGAFSEADGNSRGFIRDPWGNFTVFDFPDADSTWTNAINSSRDVVGTYMPASAGIPVPYVRYANGEFQEINVPGAIWATPVAINDAGLIAGYWGDSQGIIRGFIRYP